MLVKFVQYINAYSSMLVISLERITFFKPVSPPNAYPPIFFIPLPTTILLTYGIMHVSLAPIIYIAVDLCQPVAPVILFPSVVINAPIVPVPSITKLYSSPSLNVYVSPLNSKLLGVILFPVLYSFATISPSAVPPSSIVSLQLPPSAHVHAITQPSGSYCSLPSI